jgi:HEAT repeat protein
MKRWALAALLALAGTTPAWAEPSLEERAKALRDKGLHQQAFLLYLSEPGLEHKAAWMARPRARSFLEVLARADKVPLPRRKLIEGDLRLALGQKKEALTCYRAVVARISKKEGQGWERGWVPFDYYFVEPPDEDHSGYGRGLTSGVPFHSGPGSHRDNWLVRRFIALEDWDSAAAELERIAALHRADAQPYVVSMPSSDGKKTTDHVATPSGYSTDGLLFALDHAFFWKQRGRTDKALALLLEPLLRIDLDEPADTIGPARPPGQPLPHPRRRPSWPGGQLGGFGGRLWGSGLTQKEFVRLAYGVFKSAGKEAELVWALEKVSREGRHAARRTLARALMLQGRPEQALAQELAYLKCARLSPREATRRRAAVYEEHRQLVRASEEHERLLDLPRPGEAIDALLRLYAAQGQTKKLLRLALAQFDLEPERLDSFEQLEHAQGRLRTAGQEKRFRAWARARRERAQSPLGRAQLCWLAGDQHGALRGLVQAALRYGPRVDHGNTIEGQGPDRTVDVEKWRQRFATLGRAWELRFLREHTRARPDDLSARRKLLQREGRFDTADAIPVLEDEFRERRDDWVLYCGRDELHRANRLLRLNERGGQIDKLVSFGMRLVLGRSPFDPNRTAHRLTIDHRPNLRQIGGSDEEDLMFDSLLLLLPHVKRPEHVRALQALAQRSDSLPVKNQIARRFTGTKAVRQDVDSGHRLRYRNTTVKTAGAPASVTVLTWRDDVRAVSAGPPGTYWVGTSWGLVRYRPTRDGLSVLQLPVGEPVKALCRTPRGFFAASSSGLYRIDRPDADEPALVRVSLPLRENRSGHLPTNLHWWFDRLWIEIDRHVYRYDPAKQEVEYLGEAPQPRSDRSPALFLAAGRVWSSRGPFDDKMGLFRPLPSARKGWELIGGTAREVWASVQGPDGELQPALLDLRTGAFRIPSHQGGRARSSYHIELVDNGEKTRLLAGDNELFEYSRLSGKLHLVPLPAGGERFGAWPGRPPWFPGARYGFYVPRRGMGGEGLPGSLIAREGARQEIGEGRYLVGLEQGWEWDDFVGLFEVDLGKATWTKLGSPVAELSGADVHRLVFDDAERRLYVCTDRGLTILSLPDHKIVGHVSSTDGLPGDEVSHAVRVGRKLRLTCGRADRVAFLDLDTGLIRREPPRAEEPRYWRKRDRWERRNPAIGGLPILDGPMTLDVTHGGKRYRAGKHGLVISEGPQANLYVFPPRVAVKEVLTQNQRWREEAEGQNITLERPADLEKWLRSANPHLRAAAVAALRSVGEKRRASFLKALAPAVRDDWLPVRQAAMAFLKETSGPGVKPLLAVLARDTDLELQDRAVLELVKRGQRPNRDQLERLLGSRHLTASSRDVYKALAPLADREMFAVMLDFPYYQHVGGVGDKEVLEPLGRALRKHPEAVADLLRAPFAENRWSGASYFADAVFRYAGKSMLPHLYKALASPDRLVRANAARACGAIGDPAAVPRLRKALDLESGLSRRAIVQALVQLRARQAIPDLIRLYNDAAQDDNPQFRSSQLMGWQSAHYERLANLDALRDDWKELRAGPRSRRVEGPLLEALAILVAIRKIAPEDGQDFYRALASSARIEVRVEAAAGLAEGGPGDKARNLDVLRRLTVDGSVEVHMQATLSLAIMGDERARKAVLGWFPVHESGQVHDCVRRARNFGRLEFARPLLENYKWYEGLRWEWDRR